MYCNCFLEYKNFKDNLKEYKCVRCNKNYQLKCDKKLKKQAFNTYKYSNHDNNKCILLFQKGVYLYEHMDDWEKFNETLFEKEDLYSRLNMEDFTDADSAHPKRVFKDFKIKSLWEYDDMHV